MENETSDGEEKGLLLQAEAIENLREVHYMSYLFFPFSGLAGIGYVNPLKRTAVFKDYTHYAN